MLGLLLLRILGVEGTSLPEGLYWGALEVAFKQFYLIDAFLPWL